MRRAGALALVATLVMALPSSATAQGNDGTLSALADRYFAELWKVEPLIATRVGVHDYDAVLGDYSAAAYAERVASAKRYLGDLERIDPATLSPDGRADREILRSRLELSALEELDALQRWKHDPSTYTQIAAGSIFSLILRDFAPLPERMRSAIGRERAIPAMLATAATNITTVDATTAQLAKGNIAGSISFFERTVPSIFATVTDTALQNDFTAANRAVVAALRDFSAKMDGGPLAQPAGTYAVGGALFEKLLQLQELGPITLAEYERVGEAALARTKADFIATALKIDARKSPQAVADDLGRDHPAAGDLLPQAQRDLDELRAFVRDKHLVTLPPDWDVKVIPTPEYQRQTTFASMDSPGPLEKVATQAFYRITPVDPAWPAQRQAEHLSFFNNAYRPIISAHEVMPGHYLNFVLAKNERLSLVRKILWSPSFAEGWAHYDEEMIVDEGWGNGDPKVRLAMLQGALLRECRFLVGLREHTAGMSVDDATRFFMANAFMTQDPARREAQRGTQNPLYGYYTLGKLEILKLRADYKKKMGKNYSLQRFHDELLAHGTPPLMILRKMLLGANDTGTLL